MNWNLILTREKALHPGMNEADAIKLFYQALRGGDHLMGDIDHYLTELAREWDGLPVSIDPMPPLFQVISPSCDMARLHLVPAKSRGVSLKAVAEILEAGGFASTPERVVEEALPGFLKAIHELRFQKEPIQKAFKGDSYHHSPGYGFASYRVITFRNSS
ncbi:MAG: hypothetical protein R6V62_07100 [Candidatus Fermentibacteraceae bacterium]